MLSENSQLYRNVVISKKLFNDTYRGRYNRRIGKEPTVQKRIDILFFILLIFFTQNLSAQNFWGGRGGGPSLIKEAPAPDMGRELTLGGRLSPRRKIEHSISIAGVVSELLVDVSERVSKGTPLLEISRNVVGENYLPVYLVSRIDGVVSEISVTEQEEVKTGTMAVTIIDDTKAVLRAKVSDRDAWDMRSLAGSSISAASPDGNQFKGILESVSEEPDYDTGLFEVTMSFPRQRNLYLGMLLFVDLSLGGRGGIPIEATAIVSGEKGPGIWIINPENLFEFRLVEVSGEGDTRMISKGLDQGERYLVRPRGIEKEGLSMGEFFEASGGEDNSRGSR